MCVILTYMLAISFYSVELRRTIFFFMCGIMFHTWDFPVYAAGKEGGLFQRRDSRLASKLIFIDLIPFRKEVIIFYP